MKHIEINITNLQLHNNKSWIYFIVDQEHQKILHFGSTWLHPIARTEKHISDKLLSGYENNEHLKLVAFPLPENMDRWLLKRLLINRMDKSILNFDINFSEDHCAVSKEIEGFIENVLEILLKKIRL